MSENKGSFWTSLPGILTGLAATITAIATLYIKGIQNDKVPSLDQKTKDIPVAENLPFENWDLIDDETFTEPPPGWSIGSFPDDKLSRFDLNTVGGKYRWDMEFQVPWEPCVESPNGSAVDFYTAVDIKMTESNSEYTQAGISFGRLLNKNYTFRISVNKYFGLSRFDGTNHEMVINWTPIQFIPSELNRIAVLVDEQRMKFFLNSKLIGEYRDPSFTGGKIGLVVSASQPGTFAVVDFDNFEFRRKPQ